MMEDIDLKLTREAVSVNSATETWNDPTTNKYSNFCSTLVIMTLHEFHPPLSPMQITQLLDTDNAVLAHPQT